MRKTLGVAFLLGSAAVILWSVAVAVKSRSATQALDQEVTKANRHREQLLGDIARLPKRDETTARNEGGTLPVAAVTAKEASAALAAFPERTHPPSLMDFARDTPQLWNDFIATKRADAGRDFMPLFLRLNLTSSQQERFKDIQADWAGRDADIGAAADAKGVNQKDPIVVALRDESESQRNRELAEFFGSAVLKEIEDFERVIPLRGYVDGLAVQVARTAPLTARQADELERALAEANSTYQAGKYADTSQTDWEKVDQKAAAILTPQQFEIWKLGLTHSPYGGTRQDLELKRAYDRAVTKSKSAQ